MGKGREGYGRFRISGRGRGRYAGRVKNYTSRKEKENPGLSKYLGKSMFTYS